MACQKLESEPGQNEIPTMVESMSDVTQLGDGENTLVFGTRGEIEKVELSMG